MTDGMTQVIRPWIVEVGEAEYVWETNDSQVLTHVEWRFDKAFDLESDAKAYAERHAEDIEFIRRGKRK